MQLIRRLHSRFTPLAVLALLLTGASAQQGTGEIRVVQLQGTMEISTDRGWISIQTNQLLRAGDKLRTGVKSRASLRWSDATVISFHERTEIQILPPHETAAESGLMLLRGLVSFFHRDRPGRIRAISRGAAAGVRGTEFVMAVDENERTLVAVIDGLVSLADAQGRLTLMLTNDQQAAVELGGQPARTAGFVANNLLQWAFYYPGILDPDDLGLTGGEKQALAGSLAAYRAGDILAALAAYGTRQPASEAERLYHAALLLSVGDVEGTGAELAQVEQVVASERGRRTATALRQLIGAVKREPMTETLLPELTTELLAASYLRQSRGGGGEPLRQALDLARRAAVRSPEFGFALARVAELEFGFGRIGLAEEAVNKSLLHAPRNAQALALKGFILAAQNRTSEAVDKFNEALAVDAALANAWLGRGLCRLRRGDSSAGREDLLIAAALEPRRAQLRGYLGKAFGDSGDAARGLHELDLAKTIDPADPGAWLYSALIKAEHNRINEAIQDLERSRELNDNRSVYRSSFLLDQDGAVRGVNLANIYRDAGLTGVGLREAARAVNLDYANYSAHLFLSGSYNELRDPKLINLRYETAASAEFLLASLLSPVEVGTLSPAVSQQEYARLFERNRAGVVSATEFLGGGDWTQSGAQYGAYGNSAYIVEGFYRADTGQRPNNDLEQRLLSFTFKQQLTFQDSLFAKVTQVESSGGDLAQYYDQRSAAPEFRFDERQEPLLTAGYHREWSPGQHTLLLANWLNDRIALTNPAQPTYLLVRPGGIVSAAHALNMQEHFRSRVELVSGELQQIAQTADWTTIVGGRAQAGEIRSYNQQAYPNRLAAFFPDPPAPAAFQDDRASFRRWTGYLYQHWQATEQLRLIAGVTYDAMTFPENFRTAPVSDREETVEQFSPKAGMLWTAGSNSTVRFAYAQSLGGASLDQSFQIEPSQIAGFVQSFRSLIPESVAGANAGARFENFGLALDQKFATGTYLGLAGEINSSRVRRVNGAFSINPLAQLFATPSGVRENLDYTEHVLALSVDQLLGKEWSLGGQYRFTHSELIGRFPEVSRYALATGFDPRPNLNSMLHQIVLGAVYNHESGFFGRVDATWNIQRNDGYPPARAGDDFWQLNLLGGYRFPRRRAEISVGLLNLTGENYRLNPLTPYGEMPRQRTFVARLLINL